VAARELHAEKDAMNGGGPNPKRQRAGWSTLEKTFAEAANVWVIHYSCESFYDRPNGRSPRITSIALRNLSNGQTRSFSIHQVAEREQIEFGSIEQHYDHLEKKMLKEFFAHVGSFVG
jgi:hypothetical protein